MPITENLTHFPGGVAQFVYVGIPAAAGDVVCTGIKLAQDKLVQVLLVTHTAGVATAVSDLTSEFTITADDTINNTGGTATTDGLVLVTVAREYS